MLKYRKLYYFLSVFLVIASIVSLAVFGLKFGVDFTGGSLMEVRFARDVPSNETVESALADLDIGSLLVQKSEGGRFILRFSDVDEPTHQDILIRLEALAAADSQDQDGVAARQEAVTVEGTGNADVGVEVETKPTVFQEERFESIGPVIGEETKRKALWAVGLVLFMILIYVAWAFRKISYPLSSWIYGVVALLTLFHDVIITIGVFALLASFLDIEVGVPFVAALLTILGYSVNDTIVVFDRVRENISKRGGRFDFSDVVNRAVSQTYVRSFNTSLTTFTVLAAIFFFGGLTIKYFVMTLIIGVVVGTYSSIFLASPLLFSIYMLKFRE